MKQKLFIIIRIDYTQKDKADEAMGFKGQEDDILGKTFQEYDGMVTRNGVKYYYDRYIESAHVVNGEAMRDFIEKKQKMQDDSRYQVLEKGSCSLTARYRSSGNLVSLILGEGTVEF